MNDLKTQKKNKPEVKTYINPNPFENIAGIGKGVAESVKSDLLGKPMMTELWDQFFSSMENGKKGGEMIMGQEIDLTVGNKREKKPQLNIEPGINYRREILFGENQISNEKSREIETQVSQIVVELKKLVSSSKELQNEFKGVTTTPRIQKAGKYHVSFFEWLLSTIRTTRMRVEESANWLKMFQSKKAKQSYWNMFKKHGTTFGLSNERVVATQTG